MVTHLLFLMAAGYLFSAASKCFLATSFCMALVKTGRDEKSETVRRHGTDVPVFFFFLSPQPACADDAASGGARFCSVLKLTQHPLPSSEPGMGLIDAGRTFSA